MLSHERSNRVASRTCIICKKLAYSLSHSLVMHTGSHRQASGNDNRQERLTLRVTVVVGGFRRCMLCWMAPQKCECGKHRLLSEALGVWQAWHRVIVKLQKRAIVLRGNMERMYAERLSRLHLMVERNYQITLSIEPMHCRQNDGQKVVKV